MRLPFFKARPSASVMPAAAKAVGARAFYMGMGDHPISIEAEIESLIKNGYRTNPILFAGVERIVESFCEAPPRAFDAEDNPKDESALGQFIASMDAPNPDMTWSDLHRLTLIYRIFVGEGYWEKIRSRSRRVLQLWPLLPNKIDVIPGKNRLIDGYIYDINGKETFLPPEDVIRFPFPDPLSPYRGMSMIDAALRTIEADNSMTQSIRTLTANQFVPATLIEFGEGEVPEPDSPEGRRMIEKFKARFDLATGKTEPMFASSGTKVHHLAWNLKDIQIGELGERMETRILMALGVPPAMVSALAGLKHSGQKANVGEFRDSFHEDCIAPKHRYFAEVLNRYLAPEFGVERLKYDDSNVPARQRQRAEKQTRELEAWKVNAVTLNELRAGLGLESDPAGDVYLNGRKWGEEPESPEERREAEEEARGKRGDQKSYSDPRIGEALAWINGQVQTKGAEGLQNLVNAGIRLASADRWNGELEAAALKEIKAQRKDVIASVRSVSKAINPGDVDKVIEELAKASLVWSERGKTTFLPIMTEIVTEAAKLAAAEVGIAFNLENPQTLKFVDEYAFTFARKMGDTTVEAVRRTLAVALEQGASVADVARMLQNELPELSDDRAVRIARTETIRASNAGALEGYRSAGIIRYEWLTTSDPCIYCASLNGKTVGIGETVLPVGGELQPEGATTPLRNSYVSIDYPPLHPNCRCTVIPVVEGA